MAALAHTHVRVCHFHDVVALELPWAKGCSAFAFVLQHPAACQSDFIGLAPSECNENCTLDCRIPGNPCALQGAQTGRQALAATAPCRRVAFCVRGSTQLSFCKSGMSGTNCTVSLTCTTALWCAACCPLERCQERACKLSSWNHRSLQLHLLHRALPGCFSCSACNAVLVYYSELFESLISPC